MTCVWHPRRKALVCGTFTAIVAPAGDHRGDSYQNEALLATTPLCGFLPEVN